MNTRTSLRNWMVLGLVAAGGAAASVGVVMGAQALSRAQAAEAQTDRAVHALPASKTGDLVVGLCDGDTALEVPGVKVGQTMAREQAQTVATTLMNTWRQKNPKANWDDAPARKDGARKDGARKDGARKDGARKDGARKDGAREGGARRLAQAPAPGPAPGTPTPTGVAKTKGDTASTGARGVPAAKAAHVQSGQTYGNFSERDERIWKASTDAFVARGHAVFHDAKELGGTTGISCDMCHPDGSNTHPETYPKYQVQLGRVALLRDMINWCLENPVRGKPLHESDERMRAMEAYIYAQRKGTPLDFGKH